MRMSASLNFWSSNFYVYDWDTERRILVAPGRALSKAIQACQQHDEVAVVSLYPLNKTEMFDEKGIHWFASNEGQIKALPSSPKVAFDKIGKKPNLARSLPIPFLEVLVALAKHAYYNTGKAVINDDGYDAIEDALKRKYPASKALTVGAKASTARTKVKLPYYMGSMNKVKPNQDLRTVWPYEGPYVVTDKIDGVSLLYSNDGKQSKLYTRGDGSIGQDVSSLIPVLKLPKLKANQTVRGEIVMSQSAFAKYAEQFANPRNMMSGMINAKDASPALKDATFLVFEQLKPRLKPSKALDSMKAQGFTTVPYRKVKSLSNDELVQYLIKRKAASKYDIDGLVLYDDQAYPVNKYGNPDEAIAFKDNAALDKAIVEVVKVEWNISRHSQLKPLVYIKPVKLDGVTIQKVTAHNAAYVWDNNIGPGAQLQLVRSGQVIPYIMAVTKPAKKPQMPTNIEWEWDATETNIIAKNKATSDKHNAQLVFALKELGIENISSGSTAVLVDAGYETVEDLIKADTDDMIELLGPARGSSLIGDVKTAIKNASIVTLMVSSGVFGMGFGRSRANELLAEYPGFAVMKAKEAMQLDPPYGFSSSTLLKIAQQLPDFQAWYKSIGRSDKSMVYSPKVAKAGPLSGKVYLFSGVRDKNLVTQIENKGGTVTESWSKDVTHVIVKDLGSSSSKVTKARQTLPKDHILLIDDFRQQLNRL